MTDLTFGHIMNLSMDFHVNADTGELMKATEQGNSLTKLIRLLLFEIVPIILDLFVALFYVTSLFDISFAGILVIVTATYGLLTWKGSVWEATKRRVFAKKDRNVGKTQYASISNWTTVSYFNRGRYQHMRLMASFDDMIASLTRLRTVEYSVEAARDISLFLGHLSVSFLAAYRVSQGIKPVGNFIALNSYWSVFSQPLWVLSYISADITSYLVDAERVLQILQRKPTVTESPTARQLHIQHGEVRFTDVSFSYNKRKSTIKDISFVAKQGQTVALVGESGSGKSTVLKLLFRFYDVTSGSITIDDEDIRDVTLSSLRESLGVVPQEASLFNASIMDNVRYARLDASDEEVMEACAQACIHNKIMSFPDGYGTIVGERGVKLSGGELQRISIARIVLKKPKVLFLDEATSAVDSKTESDIQTALRDLQVGRTTFVIAHRLSTVMDADLILIVDDGSIVESGTHQDLVKRGGKYQQLWGMQAKT